MGGFRSQELKQQAAVDLVGVAVVVRGRSLAVFLQKVVPQVQARPELGLGFVSPGGAPARAQHVELPGDALQLEALGGGLGGGLRTQAGEQQPAQGELGVGGLTASGLDADRPVEVFGKQVTLELVETSLEVLQVVRVVSMVPSGRETENSFGEERL